MKKAILGSLLFCLLALFSASMAQQIPRIFSGRISEIDHGSGTVTVKGGEKDMAFYVSDETTIKTEFGAAVPFKALKSDMEVTVEYLIKEGNTNQALSIKTSDPSSGFGKIQKEKQKKK